MSYFGPQYHDDSWLTPPSPHHHSAATRHSAFDSDGQRFPPDQCWDAELSLKWKPKKNACHRWDYFCSHPWSQPQFLNYLGLHSYQLQEHCLLFADYCFCLCSVHVLWENLMTKVAESWSSRASVHWQRRHVHCRECCYSPTAATQVFTQEARSSASCYWFYF